MNDMKLPAPYDAQQIADWFCAWNTIPEAEKDDDYQSTVVFRPMTRGRLNFLMYVTQGHYLAHFGKPLYSDTLFATRRGPILDSGDDRIKRKDVVQFSPDFKITDINFVDQAFLAAVWQTYGSWYDIMIAQVIDEPPFKGLAKGAFELLTHEAMAYRFHASNGISCGYFILGPNALTEFHEGIDRVNAEFLARATLGRGSE